MDGLRSTCRRTFFFLLVFFAVSPELRGQESPESSINAPVETPGDAPVEAPVEVPAETPGEVPAEAPVEVPEASPPEPNVETPVEASGEVPVEAPGEVPVEAPVEASEASPPEPPVETPETPPSELDVEAAKEKILGEASSELVSLNLGDSSVSLFMTGYWKGTLQANWGVALGPLGTSAASGDAPLLFTQEADLTLSLWIRERWFVEASFQDDYDLNTYRAGYQGLAGETVQYAGVGNTGLDFPSFPYLDLGGDSPSSFGFYGRFGSPELTFHTLIRYDAAAREERVFVGNRERSYGYMDLSRPLKGVSFVLPDENMSSVPEVYIQDEKGGLTDNDGRKWRRAETSEYAASARYGLLELTLGSYTGGSSEPEGMIAVYYPDGASSNYSLTGNYTAAGTFLGDVQDYFPSQVDLTQYPQPGQRNTALLGNAANIPGTVTLPGGIIALVIYEPGTFSPFERQSRYQSPANSSDAAALVRLSTGTLVAGYDVIPLAETSNPVDPGLSQTAETRRGIYELFSGPSTITRRSPAEMWPLAKGKESLPELYLPGKQAFTADLGIRVTNYGSAGAYYIGTDVVPGSVEVYRGGLKDPNFSFSPSDGTVSLGNPPLFNELVRITYLRQSQERRLGSLAAGIGAVWDPEGVFSGKIALGLRWNVSSEAYSEEGASSPGTVGLGAEARWDMENLKTGVTLGLAFEQPDTTDLYRVTGMEGNEFYLSLPPGNSFVSETPAVTAAVPAGTLRGRAPLVYRNYLDTSMLGTSSLTSIESGASVVSGKSGPYPARDPQLSSQVLVAEFELNQDQNWTGFETPLGIDGDALEQAKEIQMPFRLYNVSGDTNNFKVIFQAGSLADEGSFSSENPNLVLEQVIFEQPASPDSGARIAVITLDDEKRKKLKNAKYLRLLVVYSTLGSWQTVSGRVLLAPPIVKGAGFRPVTVEGNEIRLAEDTGASGSVSTVETLPDSGLSSRYGSLINRLHQDASKAQRALEISWKNLPSLKGPGADGRVGAIPLYNYRSLSFFVRRPEAASASQDVLDKGTLRFILGRGPGSLNNPREIALEAKIPLQAIEDAGIAPGQWTQVEVRYRGGDQGVYIEGNRVADVSYRPGVYAMGGNQGAAGSSSYMAFLIQPDGVTLPDGTMAVDEVILEEASPSYHLNTGNTVEWKKSGTILELKGAPVISDFFVSAALETGAQGDPFSSDSDKEGIFGMAGRSRAEVTVMGARLDGNYAYTLNSDTYSGETGITWNAGHGISRSWGPFSAAESFADSPGDKTMNHRFSMELSGPFRSGFSAEALYEENRLFRKWGASVGAAPADSIPLDLSLEGSAGWTENSSVPEEILGNYGGAWAGSWEYMVPDSGYAASRRESRLLFKTSLGTEPLGAELSLEGSTSFSRLSETTQGSTLARLDLPWNPLIYSRTYRFLFRIEREYQRAIFYEAKDIWDDEEKYAESLKDSLPLMFSIPFYSFFDSRMGEKMTESNEGFLSDSSGGLLLNYGKFSDKFEFSLRMPENYGLSSLVIPSQVSVRINRILEQKLDTPTDTLNLGGGLGFSSINMFGAFGAVPVFSLYQSDEFSHSIDAAVVIPKNEKISWKLQAEQAMNFHGFTGAELIIDNTFTISSSSYAGTGNRWTDSLGLEWIYPMKSSLLGSLYSKFTGMARKQSSWLVMAGIAEAEYEQIRKETLEFVYEHAPATSPAYSDYNRYSVIVGHESIVRVFGRLNLSVFARLHISEDSSTEVLSFLGTVGTTLNLTF